MISSCVRHAIRAVTGFVAVAALAGCGALGGASSSPSGGNDKVEKAVLNVADNETIDTAGFHIALDKGYFRQEGLDVRIAVVSGSQEAIPRMINRSIDIGWGNWISFLMARQKNTLHFKAIGETYQTRPGMTALAAMPTSGIRSPKDLAGKKIGINSFGSHAELTSRAVLEASGVDPNSVHFVTVSLPNALHALQTDQVDAMSLQEPNLTQAKDKLGITVVADRAEGSVADFPNSGFAVTDDFAKQYPKTISAFQRALAKGQADAVNRQLLVDELTKYAKIDQQTASRVTAGVFPTSVDPARLQRCADLMTQYHMLPAHLDIQQLLYRP